MRRPEEEGRMKCRQYCNLRIIGQSTRKITCVLETLCIWRGLNHIQVLGFCDTVDANVAGGGGGDCTEPPVGGMNVPPN